VPTITPTPVATITPVATVVIIVTATPTARTPSLDCNLSQPTLFANGVTITGQIDCKYLKKVIDEINLKGTPADKELLFRMIQLIQSQTDKAAFITAIEESFGVDIQGDGLFEYQGLVNLTLALTQTNYAFWFTTYSKYSDNTRPTLSAISKKLLGGLIIRRQNDGNTGGEGGITNKGANGPIVLFGRDTMTNKDAYPQTPRNIVHELGHFIECKLYNFGCKKKATDLESSDSIYGQIAARKLVTDDGEALISNLRDNGMWIRGRDGWGIDPLRQDGRSGGWEQNPTYEPTAGCVYLCIGYEEAADMFLNWVYDIVYKDVFRSDRFGRGRRNFMETVISDFVVPALLN
jgi:hypothetical protein